MTKWLEEIPELYLELHERHQADPRPLQGNGSGSPGQLGLRVGGSKERKLPIDVDAVDLLWSKENSMLLVGIDGDRGSELILDDQVGSTSVLGLLSGWVSLYRWLWYPKESMPVLQVPTLALWLRLRIDDLVLVDQSTPELADALRRCVGQLRAALGQRGPKPEFRYGRCEKCRMRTLWWHPDWDFVQCANCNHTMTNEQYAQYLKITVRLRPRDIGIHAETEPDPELTTPV